MLNVQYSNEMLDPLQVKSNSLMIMKGDCHLPATQFQKISFKLFSDVTTGQCGKPETIEHVLELQLSFETGSFDDSALQQQQHFGWYFFIPRCAVPHLQRRD